MKMIAGEFFSASSKALRRLLSDSPASLLMISGPLMRKKKAPVSLATALAMRVLPVPGGPYSSIPRGGCTPTQQAVSPVGRHVLTISVLSNLSRSTGTILAGYLSTCDKKYP